MKTFFGGIVVGALVSTLVLLAYGLGTAAKAQQGPREVAPSDCQVSVGIGELTSGTQCDFNKVMTGTQGSYLLCSDITVTCQ